MLQLAVVLYTHRLTLHMTQNYLGPIAQPVPHDMPHDLSEALLHRCVTVFGVLYCYASHVCTSCHCTPCTPFMCMSPCVCSVTLKHVCSFCTYSFTSRQMSGVTLKTDLTQWVRLCRQREVTAAALPSQGPRPPPHHHPPCHLPAERRYDSSIATWLVFGDIYI